MLGSILGFGAIIVFLLFATRGKKQRENYVEETPAGEMTESDKVTQQQIDLHYGRRDFSENKNYVEFSFSGPFGEVFSLEWLGANPDLNGDELFALLDTLNIPYDRELIFDRYEGKAGGSVEVFHSTRDEQVFAYFDLRGDAADQVGLFFFGLSCKRDDEKMVHELLLEIYRKLQTSSAFSFDMLNHPLYNKTFSSYFYFYESNYDESQAQLNHHNL